MSGIVDKLIDKAFAWLEQLVVGSASTAKLEEPLGQLQTEKVAQDAIDRRRLEQARRDGSR